MMTPEDRMICAWLYRWCYKQHPGRITISKAKLLKEVFLEESLNRWVRQTKVWNVIDKDCMRKRTYSITFNITHLMSSIESQIDTTNLLKNDYTEWEMQQEFGINSGA